jgi:hypothetical protein
MPTVSHRLGDGGLTTLEQHLKPIWWIALALLVAYFVIGGAAKGFQRRSHAHVDTAPTRTAAERIVHRYFNAIRDDDKRTDCRMYRIPGCSDRTSLRLAAAVARALVP